MTADNSHADHLQSCEWRSHTRKCCKMDRTAQFSSGIKVAHDGDRSFFYVCNVIPLNCPELRLCGIVILQFWDFRKFQGVILTSWKYISIFWVVILGATDYVFLLRFVGPVREHVTATIEQEFSFTPSRLRCGCFCKMKRFCYRPSPCEMADVYSQS